MHTYPIYIEFKPIIEENTNIILDDLNGYNC